MAHHIPIQDITRIPKTETNPQRNKTKS
uniref:Uncharacterized protein n=1 Tax=Rhizophora mucronata TaxID=61149 RepID=A0A2P2IY56_RHIMU